MDNSASEILRLHDEGEPVPDSLQDFEACKQNETSEQSLFIQKSKRPSLSSLHIPTRSLESVVSSFIRIDIPSSPSSTRAGLPPRPNSAKFKSSVRNLLSQRSFQAKNASHEIEKTVLMIPDTIPSDGCPDKPSTSRSFSLNKILFPSAKAPHSLPATPMASSGPEIVGRRNQEAVNCSKPEVKRHITRTFSVPMHKNRSLRRMDSGGLIRIIPASPQSMDTERHCPNDSVIEEASTEDKSEDIPEEEAVCRICLVEFSEGGETLKMECSCKGELALAHQECAIKWFSIKGNKTCDICKQDVRNLPVTLLRLPRPETVIRRSPSGPQQRGVIRYRIWQDVTVLVIVSMLAYFCFLEQLLSPDLGPRALAISLPFSCILGLLSSLISSTMVSRGYIWAYASFQLAIVILFAYIFYNILNVGVVLSVFLSSFTGFGIAICANSLLMEFIKWRANRQREAQSYENGAPRGRRQFVQEENRSQSYPQQSAHGQNAELPESSLQQQTLNPGS
ncbi:hypothetical protein SAY87_026991 [Trapa incisa]|uniref:RING-CH-type domain-containing protein n=1 Tax=Trapa incisa TaxID=236973 RepID=A0AAN7JLR2_9MYRT|nr:hypothetical protein SAY87_026991 [Trapa incisa]